MIDSFAANVTIVADDPKYMPVQKHITDIGFDLVAAIDEPITVSHMNNAIINTGVRISLPIGVEAQVRLRSSLGAKGWLIPNAPGTIDPGYIGYIKINLLRWGRIQGVINPGERIAQLVFAKVCQVKLVKVDEPDLLAAAAKVSNRGTGGYGSTGA